MIPVRLPRQGHGGDPFLSRRPPLDPSHWKVALLLSPIDEPLLSADTRSKMRGRTVLYIPIEALGITPEVAVKDKALVQRLESE